MLGRVVDALTGNQKIKGCVVLMKKDVLGLNDFKASAIDKVEEFFGNRVELHLVSAVQPDPVNNDRGKIGTSANLENWAHLNQAGESTLDVQFEWDDHFGTPGAIIVKNNHSSEFFLKSITLDDVSLVSHVHFDCNSWIYPVNKYKYDRIFFTNQTYLPSEMPLLLRPYRDQELVNLRGTGKGELKEWDRVYDYALYNDLGDPDKSPEDARPVLGNSTEFPYPRRGRTGRPPTKTDPNTESRLPPLVSLNIYVPRDERFGHLKMSDFLAWAIKSITQFVQPGLKSVLDPKDEYETFEDTYKIYEGGIKIPKLNELSDIVPIEIIKELLRTDGAGLYKFPTPQVIQDSKEAWRADEEFAREMLAGVNPVIISLLKDFPPKSKLDPAEYGNQNSSISAQHIEKGLDGLSVREALAQNKLFILDHHDTLMPYLSRINSTKETKTYASRTLLFLNPDGTLRPLAIELSLPHPDGQRHGAVSKVFTPAKSGIENALWQLAKAYVTVNDSGVHQLISHFLKTHAVIEPFVIATHRQLSAVHPVHKLLSPHYRDTMNINALARQILINAGGILERTVFPGRYAMEMSAVVYRSWVFTEQGLPADLLKRGMAVEDSTQSSKLRLLIEDYPYAVDGLEIWSAIEEWVADYCAIYYPSDDMVEADVELQAWWKEVRELGHGDKKDEPWWPAMRTVSDLASTCTTIIWVSSALHAATNFGQYPYAGYFPNRPTGSRRFMPEPGTPEWAELESDPARSFLGTISGKFQSLLGIAIIEILSRHSSDEVYLGRRASDGWTGDQRAINAFQRFGERLENIEEQIMRRNGDAGLKNRVGPVNIAYTLLYPSTSNPGQATGITGKGIPNSVSI